MSLDEMIVKKTVESTAKLVNNGRWRRAYTLSGIPAGANFVCERCHLRVQYTDADKIFHCGAWEDRPDLTPSSEEQEAFRTSRVRFV